MDSQRFFVPPMIEAKRVQYTPWQSRCQRFTRILPKIDRGPTGSRKSAEHMKLISHLPVVALWRATSVNTSQA